MSVSIINPKKNKAANVVILKDGRKGLCRDSRTTIKWAKKNGATLMIVFNDGSGHIVPARLVKEIMD